MKRPCVAIFLAALLVVCSSALASATPAPELTARAAFLYEPTSGTVLYEKAADEQLAPASLTKLMTMYVAYRTLAAGDISLSQQTKVSEKAWRTGGSQMFIREGEMVSIDSLLDGIAIVSGNDACVALAEAIAGTEGAFVDRMNREAQRLGLTHTYFANSHGLDDPGQYSSARDIGLLSEALIEESPESVRRLSTLEYTYAEITQPNRNGLLRVDDRVDGLKTGYTEQAGYCIAVSAKKKGMRLIAVIMNTESERAREAEATALLNWGFSNFATVNPVAEGERLGTVRVWQGRANEVSAVSSFTSVITVPAEARDSVTVRFEPQVALRAPIERGQSIGTITVWVGEEQVAEGEAVAAETVPRGSLWRRIIDAIRLLFVRK